MVCGNPVIGHVAGAGNHRVVENVETTTTCIRYFLSILSGQESSGHSKRSESCFRAQGGPHRQSELLTGARIQRRNGVTVERPT
jgi:hypothetical protein